MANQTQTYVFVATAAESLGLSTTEVMDLIDTNTLRHAEVEGRILIDTASLAQLNPIQAVAV